MTREEMLALNPGDCVVVQYLGYEIEANVVEVEPYGRYGPQRDWVMIEQVTDFEDREERPTFEAAREYMSRPGETPAPKPFGGLYTVVGRTKR